MKIKLNTETLYTCNGVRLMPGINVVPDEKGEAMLGVKAFKHRVDQGIIEVLSSKRVTAKDVAEMYDAKELERLADEGTKAVKESAIKRLDELQQLPETEG